MAKVSVILISYNHEKYLQESIESVLNQTFSDFELLIVDDSSTDASWQIITRYSDPRIQVFKSEINTMYGGDGRKVISEVANGEYIAIQHSDDIWEPDKLEKQVAFLDSHPNMGAVFTWVNVINESGEPHTDQLHPYQKVFEKQNLNRFEWLRYFFYQGNALCHPSVLIRKVCYDDCGLYRFGLAQLADFDMWVRLCLKYEIYVLPEKLVRFRVRDKEANASGDRPEMRIRLQFEFLQIYSNYLLINDADTFLAIFPESAKFFNKGGLDIPFALAMMALSSPYPSGELFGLQLLFNIINNPEHAKKIEQIYGFRHRDLVALTAKHDVFSVIALEEMRTKIEKLLVQIRQMEQELQFVNQQMNEILMSKAWKFTLFLRQQRKQFLPINGTRYKIVRKIYRFLKIRHK